MIYSKKHNFLFLKGVKVAGTSVEIALSKICGNKDIITPIANIDERTRVQSNIRHAQNYGPKSRNKRLYSMALHVPTEQITSRQAPRGSLTTICLSRESTKLDQLHPEIRAANIFAVVRSPYEQVLSRVNHKVNFKGYKTSGETMQASQSNLRQELDRYIARLQQRSMETYRSKNFQICDSSFDQSIDVQFIRFENLKVELDHALHQIGVKEILNYPLPKKDFSPAMIYSKKLRRLTRSKLSTTTQE